MENISIQVQDLVIVYKELQRLSLRSLSQRDKDAPPKGFMALKGVSFDVKRGEIVGIIGENGSGKSTLLRSIAGVFSPDKGTVCTYKQTVSLLAIGVGFQKELSGRENILLSGLLLGFSKKEIDAHMEEIIQFSEIGNFIDKPVKVYSSGMYSRLAFSITAIMRADIILIDEVLSVGDAKFRKKSYDKMKELITDKDRTVVMVSHSMHTIQSLCDSAIWLQEGEVAMHGKAKDVIQAYEATI